ncbi:phosphopantetheine-binding protein [Roseburia inulinivorans]|jgi:D-alanine--poly(phosphoribitol) ligase subunit 2|uniref:Acyl carrier protein n=1 Tax=Roseburia inulinivorans TaxID=360807 RepID=A0A396AD03_9FIRM|nr:phosphopantetheine-binding protein [Roseburia inulinivorans]RHD00941.1 acyl carrier protein [Roseburia inulinivorans]
MKEKILDVLAEVNKDIISYNGDNLFDAGILDSLQVVNLIAELEDALDIDIDAAYVVEDNFKTKEAIIAMIEMIIQKRVIS